MKHERQTQFGRPMTAVQSSDLTLVDKWQTLQDLSDGAEDFGLNHRTLGVLRALLTFHRDRYIGPEPLGAVVFPSNKTLSHRLNGMPESTLRRHLCQLVASGIVIRHDSANRKRFKRRAGVAYGFDLAPLAQNAAYITKIADTARDKRDQLANLRDQVAQRRQDLLQVHGSCNLTEEARITLRRKPDATVLQSFADRLAAKITAVESEKMSRAAAQTERHIHSESLYNSDRPSKKTKPLTTTSDPTLIDILDQCTEYKLYYPKRVRHWNDAFEIASRLSGMMGIDQNVFHDAVSKLGKKQCVAAIFGLLDRLPTIDNPGGYLRRIAQNIQFDQEPVL
jgi:replication initiation protein RepC